MNFVKLGIEKMLHVNSVRLLKDIMLLMEDAVCSDNTTHLVQKMVVSIFLKFPIVVYIKKIKVVKLVKMDIF